MKIYKVGGAVRDKLMGLQPKDNDWLVVGASVLEMEKIGFQKVGKDFPVFLHSETKEEYALARKESKTGKGTDLGPWGGCPTPNPPQYTGGFGGAAAHTRI